MKRTLLSILITSGLLTYVFPGYSATSIPESTVSETSGEEALTVDLLTAFAERLRLMPDVANWKHLNGKDIDDPGREQQLLNLLEEKGKALGLNPLLVRAFFQSQFEAAKLYQKQYIRSQGEKLRLAKAPDLNQETRPKISALTNKILKLLGGLNHDDRSVYLSGALLKNHSEILKEFDKDVIALTLSPIKTR